ncbi:MAG: ammonium transporter [Planctomycetota bacterium]|nr:ammonium transporter [Planctomycetota bacterium]
MTETTTAIDAMWVLGCTAAVFLMQAGFCCLETGLVRAKNSVNVAIKNLVDICVSACVFWLVGFGIMFGASSAGWYGTSGFCFESVSVSDSVFFLFQVAFCGTATTIVSGAVAERMKFSGYILVTLLISGLIYPVSGHWAWGGLMSGDASGWLARMGYIDFAGSSVVHAVGGSVALAAILIIGPRRGRFDGDPKLFHGHNLPMSAIGVLLLWVGWFGFNGGSTLAMTDLVPQILINTGLAAAAGGIGTLAVVWLLTRRADVYAVQNGILAGLVSVTACCHVIGPESAILIGMIGGWIAAAATRLLERLQLDDVVGAVPVHLGAGIWGVLAVAMFGTQSELLEVSRWDQFLVQLLGITSIVGWAFTSGFGLLWLVDQLVPLRVSAEDERVGLNVSEHDASYELLDLLTEMELHCQSGDFSHPTTITSETEVGQIAAQYNRVLQAVNDDRASLIKANEHILESGNHVAVMHRQLQEKVTELEEFNGCSVGRELRMIELKLEVNELAEKLGLEPQYDVVFDNEFDGASREQEREASHV